jgi:pSer/pThr/pTyr-binding forkhead associated (FHA) protein
MSYLLVALDGGPDIPTGREPIVVGRHPLCDVRLHSIRVSRRHCFVTEFDGVVIVRDLGSSNGTLINGRRVEAGRLRPDDLLSIANLRYRLEPGQPNPASTADSQAGMTGDGASLTVLPGTGLFDTSHSGQPGQQDDDR